MSTDIERLVANGENVRETIKLFTSSWADIAAKLPDDFDPHHKNFARTYFRVQLRIARGQRKRAGQIFRGLKEKHGYLEFENQNKPLLAAIDIAVRGNTNWADELRRPIVPSFRRNGSSNP
jgi:hypothetical protein